MSHVTPHIIPAFHPSYYLQGMWFADQFHDHDESTLSGHHMNASYEETPYTAQRSSS